MALAVRYRYKKGELRRNLDDATLSIASAVTGAVRQSARQAQAEGRADIASAGFPLRWQRALRVRDNPTGKAVSLSPSSTIFHSINYAGVFAEGATISGAPLLWLPIEANLPRAKRSIDPKTFIALGGKLRKAKRASGAPLLIGKGIGGRDLPLFVGVPSVRIPKKFNIYSIIARAADRVAEFYVQNLKVK